METILSDLAIDLPFVKGQNLPVRNCWHFSTDGTVRDVESRGGAISRLSLPDMEMRQHKQEILLELFAKKSSRELDTAQRLRLAREIRRRYNCSVKQISRLVGLSRENLEVYLK